MAKKKLSRNQKRKLKKRRKERSPQRIASHSRDKMLGRLKDTGEKHQVIQTPVGDAKMSEVMWEFLDPYLKDAPTPDLMHKLVSIALAAWNASFLPATVPLEETLQEPMQAIPPDLRPGFMDIMKDMIERKRKYFAQYNRPILDYELVNTREGYHLSVASVVDPKEIEK